MICIFCSQFYEPEALLSDAADGRIFIELLGKQVTFYIVLQMVVILGDASSFLRDTLRFNFRQAILSTVILQNTEYFCVVFSKMFHAVRY